MNLDEIQQMEQEWNETTPKLENAYGFQPFRMHDFRVMLMIAASNTKGRKFLDAGCGIGSKVWVAQNEFGLDAYGIDIVDEYLSQAHSIGVRAGFADIRDYQAFGEYDIIYYYGPFREYGEQAAFETRLHAEMKPGALLMTVLAAVKPYSWEQVFRRPWQGIWRKPDNGGQRVPRRRAPLQ